MTTDYSTEARDDARDTIRNFVSDVVEQLLADGRASDDLNNDYPDGNSWHHESHVDKEYSLLEAAELLDDLSDHIETDSGLWEGLEPRAAISAQAAYTYGQAVYSEWSELIEEINSDDNVEKCYDLYVEFGDAYPEGMAHFSKIMETIVLKILSDDE